MHWGATGTRSHYHGIPKGNSWSTLARRFWAWHRPRWQAASTLRVRILSSGNNPQLPTLRVWIKNRIKCITGVVNITRGPGLPQIHHPGGPSPRLTAYCGDTWLGVLLDVAVLSGVWNLVVVHFWRLTSRWTLGCCCLAPGICFRWTSGGGPGRTSCWQSRSEHQGVDKRVSCF